MILKEFTIKELKMNGMEVGFEKCKVILEKEYVRLYNDINMSRLEWYVKVDFIETDLSALYRYKRAIDLEMVTDEGDLLKGKALVTAVEEKNYTELTGVDKLNEHWGEN